MSTERPPLQTHLLIQCFAEYSDRVWKENIYLRFMMRDLREVFELAHAWKNVAEQIAVQEMQGNSAPDLAHKIAREHEAALFIAVDLLAGTTCQNPEPTA
jgi:hypothetical protein